MKEKFAQKMLDEKLNFLPIEDSLQLFEAGELVETEKWWVANIEELGGEHYDMTSRQIYEEIDEIMGDYGYEVGNYDHFDGFTHKLCPAPTYIELIK